MGLKTIGVHLNIYIPRNTFKHYLSIIDQFSSNYDICWEYYQKKTFQIFVNQAERNLSTKVFTYVVFCSTDILKICNIRMTHMCDNRRCINPFHLHPLTTEYPHEKKIYEDILSRMRNPNNPFYKDYGGRGLELDKRWNPDLHLHGVARINFVNDIHELGYQRHLSIDRIDNNKGYTKDNIRFVDWKTRGQNRRSTKLKPEDIVYIRSNHKRFGGNMTANELAKMFKVHPTHILAILRNINWVNVE